MKPGLKSFAIISILFFLGFSARSQPSCSVTYEVPTQDPSLKPYTRLCLPTFQRRDHNGSIEITFTLPLELTGKAMPMIFQSLMNDPDISDFWGENGTMACTGSECKVTDYKNLHINLADISDYLKSQGTPEPEFSKRMEVARSFSGDPGGVIHLPQPNYR